MTRGTHLKHHLTQASAAGGTHRIFLTPSQAVDAIAMDFQAYGPQPDLFRCLAPLVLEDRCRISHTDHEPDTVWIRQREIWCPVTDENLGFYLIHVLETSPPHLDTLADICRRVFQTKTAAGNDSTGTFSGIWIRSQMDGFVCRQCGKCCRTLDYETSCDKSDIQRWQDMGRTDILAWVHCRNRAGDADAQPYRIWVNPDTGKTAQTCPWLFPCPDQDRFLCTIHDIKPEVCREYPFTSKHAAMTGCKGRFATQTAEPDEPMNTS
jgi:Fe-S-cluster containining protein